MSYLPTCLFNFMPNVRSCRKRTNVYEGLTPLWKESLDLPFTPPMADFSPANLAQVRLSSGRKG